MFHLAIYLISFVILFPLNLSFKNQVTNKPVEQIEVRKVLGEKIKITEIPTPTIAQIAATPTAYPTIIPIDTATPTPQTDNSAGSSATWGEAKQIDKETYTMTVQNDNSSATPGEILVALNNYRSTHGVSNLSWDDRLGGFAQGRADQFNRDQKLDSHAGFNQLFADSENVKKLGFMALGENSSFGFTLNGVHLIEWVYAGDAPHNNNQLDSKWTNVGIGVSGTATDLIFGGSKL